MNHTHILTHTHTYTNNHLIEFIDLAGGEKHDLGY